jgi:hypothetical protein
MGVLTDLSLNSAVSTAEVNRMMNIMRRSGGTEENLEGGGRIKFDVNISL